MFFLGNTTSVNHTAFTGMWESNPPSSLRSRETTLCDWKWFKHRTKSSRTEQNSSLGTSSGTFITFSQTFENNNAENIAFFFCFSFVWFIRTHFHGKANNRPARRWKKDQLSLSLVSEALDWLSWTFLTLNTHYKTGAADFSNGSSLCLSPVIGGDSVLLTCSSSLLLLSSSAVTPDSDQLIHVWE